jgi:hypothetical protein
LFDAVLPILWGGRLSDQFQIQDQLAEADLALVSEHQTGKLPSRSLTSASWRLGVTLIVVAIVGTLPGAAYVRKSDPKLQRSEQASEAEYGGTGQVASRVCPPGLERT